MEPSTEGRTGKKKAKRQKKPRGEKKGDEGGETETDEREGTWLDGDNLVVEDPVAASIVQELKGATYVDFEKKGELGHWDMSAVSSEVDREKETEVISFEGAKVVGIDGISAVDFDGTGSYDRDKDTVDEISEEEFLHIDRRRNDEIKRNRDEYMIYCPSCRNTRQCGKCGGKGKRGILRRKCGECGGVGRCAVCRGDFHMACPQCDEIVSGYSTSCKHCGKMFRCPDCLHTMPLMAARCISCRKEFLCKFCKEKIPVNDYDKCPKCG